MSATCLGGRLRTERLDDGRRELLRELIIDLGERLPMEHYTEDGAELYPGWKTSWDVPVRTVVTVPAGFDTDFSSIPGLIRGWYLFEKCDLAGVVHDYAYRVGLPRDAADRAWVLVAEMDPPLGRTRTWLGWLGLRIGGRPAYRMRARGRPA